MRTAWLEFWTGLGGDMFLGSLLDAGWPEQNLRAGIESLGLGPVDLLVERRSHLGLSGLGVRVAGPEEASHRSCSEIAALLAASRLPAQVQGRSLEVFRQLGLAESRIHGIPLERVHFHEVGALDSLVDIVGTVLAVEDLGIERLLAGPVPLGGGVVEMAHGRIPVPAPATSLLLEGWPVRPVQVEGEFFTPTAAALLRVLASPAPVMPALRVERVGFGAGTKTHPHWPNLVRIWIGQELRMPGSWPEVRGEEPGLLRRTVGVLETQIDDMDPRFLAALAEDLLDAGALDVFRTPVQMKKGRLGTLLTVICEPEQAGALARQILTGSTTLGVRVREEARWEWVRQITTESTPLGEVRVKWAGPSGARRSAPEYEDIRRLGREHGLSLEETERIVRSSLPPAPAPDR